MVDALLLAGSSGVSDLTENEQVLNKSFIQLNGKPILFYILEALKSCPDIQNKVIVGPGDELKDVGTKYDAEVIQEKGTIAQNLLAGARSLASDNYILLVTADIPLITREALEDFLNRCQPFSGADFFYPIVAKDVNEEKFPGVEKTYVSLKEGSFTGGNIMLINPVVVEKGVPRVEKFIEARKSPLKMARLLGSRFIFKLAAKRLSVKELEENFSRLLEIKSKAVISPYPEIGTDIDKASDLEYIRKFMN